MSQFSNPASAGGADAASYTASLLELLNGRDPLESMREMPAKLAAAVMKLYAAHDLVHLRQIERIRDAASR